MPPRYIAVPFLSSGPFVVIPNPTLSAIVISSSEIDLTASYVGPPGVVAYTFEYSSALNGPFVPLASQNTPIFKHVGLDQASTWYYRVRVQVTDGRFSNFSSTAIATTLSSTPGQVTGLAASSPSNTEADLSWNSAQFATSYNVYVNSVLTYTGITGTVFNITSGIFPGTQYQINVSGVNSSGEGLQSTSVLVGTASPVVPTGLAVIGVADTSASLTWNTSSGAVTYNLYRNGSLVKSSISGVATTDSGLTSGTTYSYTVTGVNAVGESNPSNPATATTTRSSFNPNYPRLAAGRLQSSTGASSLQYNTAYTNWASYMCIQALGLNYDGGAASGPGFPNSNREQYVQTLKSTNRTGGIVMQYQESSTVPTAGQSWPGFDSYVAARNWYQYAAGSSGTISKNGSYNMPNESTYVPLDANGHIEQEYRALYTYANLVSGTGSLHSFASTLDAAPSIDGFFWDDTWYSPLVNCDPQRTGATQNMQSVCQNQGTTVQNLAEQWRAGQKRKFALLDTLMPGNFHFANFNGPNILVEFGGPSGVASALANPQQWAGSFWQLFDGFEIQLFFGWGFFEGSASFTTMMNCYQLAMAICRGPKLVQLDIGGGSTANNLTSDGRAPQTWSGENVATYTAPYVGMRYYTAFTAMGTGALDHDGELNSTNLNLLTFDEWGNNTAQYPSGFLGQPVDAVQTAAKYGNGIWERRFFNPSTNQFFRVVMNPRGNGAQTYSPGVTLFKMRGVQNPSYNNAASFTTLSMASPDGGIFCESPQ